MITDIALLACGGVIGAFVTVVALGYWPADMRENVAEAMRRLASKLSPAAPVVLTLDVRVPGDADVCTRFNCDGLCGRPDFVLDDAEPVAEVIEPDEVIAEEFSWTRARERFPIMSIEAPRVESGEWAEVPVSTPPWLVAETDPEEKAPDETPLWGHLTKVLGTPEITHRSALLGHTDYYSIVLPESTGALR